MVFPQVIAAFHALFGALGLPGNLMVIVTTVVEARFRSCDAVYSTRQPRYVRRSVLSPCQLNPRRKHSKIKIAMRPNNVPCQFTVKEFCEIFCPQHGSSPGSGLL